MRRYGPTVLIFVAVALALSAGRVAGALENHFKHHTFNLNPALRDPWVWLILMLGFVLVLVVLVTLDPAGFLTSGSAEEGQATRGEKTCPHCGERLTDWAA